MEIFPRDAMLTTVDSRLAILFIFPVTLMAMHCVEISNISNKTFSPSFYNFLK